MGQDRWCSLCCRPRCAVGASLCSNSLCGHPNIEQGEVMIFEAGVRYRKAVVQSGDRWLAVSRFTFVASNVCPDSCADDPVALGVRRGGASVARWMVASDGGVGRRVHPFFVQPANVLGLSRHFAPAFRAHFN